MVHTYTLYKRGRNATVRTPRSEQDHNNSFRTSFDQKATIIILFIRRAQKNRISIPDFENEMS